jgi:hypothetical protein
MTTFTRDSLVAAALTAMLAAACSGPSSAPADGANTAKGQGKPAAGGDGVGGATGGGDNGATPPEDKPKTDVTPPNSSGGGDAGVPKLFVWNDKKIFAGFDGTTNFDVTTAAMVAIPPENGSDEPATDAAATAKIKFSIVNTAIATVKPIALPTAAFLKNYPGLMVSTFAVITPRAAGSTTLRATDGTQTVESEIVVTAYTAALLAVGKTRYTAPANASPTRKACTSCHGMPQAVDHDTFMQSWYSDTEILEMVTKGQRVYFGDTMPTPFDMGELKDKHTWDLTADEQKAIPAYLRSLHTLKL